MKIKFIFRIFFIYKSKKKNLFWLKKDLFLKYMILFWKIKIKVIKIEIKKISSNLSYFIIFKFFKLYKFLSMIYSKL